MHPRCQRCIYLSFTFRFSRAWKWYSMNRRTLIKNNRTLFLFPSSFRVHMSRSINEYYYQNKDNKHASMHWRKIVFPRALLSPPAKKREADHHGIHKPFFFSSSKIMFTSQWLKRLFNYETPHVRLREIFSLEVTNFCIFLLSDVWL